MKCEVQGQTVQVVPAALALSASFTVYKLMKLLTFPKKIPGAYYPPLAPASEIKGGIIALTLFGHLADVVTVEAQGKAGTWYRRHVSSLHQRPMAMTMGFGTQKLSPVHPDDVEYILVKNPKNFPKSPMYAVFGRALGNGLFTQLDESVYYVHRAECAKAFAPASLKLIANECVNAHVGKMLENLGAAADEKRLVEMNTEMLHVGLRITAQAAFRVNDEESMKTIWDLYGRMIGDLWSVKRFTKFGDKVALYKENVRLAACRKQLNEMAQGMLDSLKNLPPPEEGQGKSLIDYLVHTTKMDQQTVLDNVLTFLFAGFDTTATSMFGTLWYLSKHTEEQEKLFEELSTALSLGQHPTLDNVKGCDYLKKVWRSVRAGSSHRSGRNSCASSPKSSGRHCSAISGTSTVVPAGTNCLLCGRTSSSVIILVVCPAGVRSRSPSLLGTFGFVPFSIGPHGCPGKDFAVNEMWLVIATVIRNFKIQWPEDEPEPFLVSAPTIQPKFPVKMHIERRTA